MGTVKDIERALLRLSPTEFDEFREWFVEQEAAAWDRQIEGDIAAGRLDTFAAEAIGDLKANRCTDVETQS